MTLTIEQSPTPIVKTRDDRLHQPGRDEDGHLQEHRALAAFASADDAQGRRAAGPGRDEDSKQLRRVPGHLLARVGDERLGCDCGLDRDRRGGRRRAVALAAALCVWLRLRRAPRGAAGAARRRQGRSRRLRRLPAGADRRPPPRGRRDRGGPRRGSTGASTASVSNDVDRPLRRLRGHRRAPVRVARAARRVADRRRHHARSRAATTRAST